MPKKSFNTDTTAAAELFNPAPAPVAEQKTAPAQSKKKTAEPTPEIAPVITWRARPDGEKRNRRMQIVCKPSVAMKAAEIARTRGISIGNLFEKLILEQWEKDNPEK